MLKPTFPTPPPRHAGSFLRNAVFLAASRGVQIASGFFVLLAVARALSLDDYGQYAYVTALAGAVVAMTYFGIQQVMIRDMVHDHDQAPAIVGRAIVLRLALTAAAGAVLAGIGFFADLSPPARTALVLAFGVEACRAMAMLGCAVFQGYERMGYEPPLSIVSGLASLALVALALALHAGFVGVLTGLLAATALFMLLTWLVVARRFTRPRFDLDWPSLWRMFATASVVGLGIFFHQNLFRANTLALKWLADLDAVAAFQAPHEFILKLEILPQALMLAVFPALARLLRSDPAQAGALYRLVFRHVLHVLALPSLLLFYYAEPACVLFFGEKFRLAAPVMRYLSLALAPLALDMLLNNLLIAMDRQRYALYYAAAALALNVAGNWYAAPRFGAHGSAVVALVSYLWLLAFSLRFAARHGFPPAVGRPLARVLAAGIACLGVCHLLRGHPIAGAVAGATAYVVVLLLAGACSRSELAAVRSLIIRPRPGATPGGYAHESQTRGGNRLGRRHL